jgi:hypothetical protein
MFRNMDAIIVMIQAIIVPSSIFFSSEEISVYVFI